MRVDSAEEVLDSVETTLDSEEAAVVVLVETTEDSVAKATISDLVVADSEVKSVVR